MGVLTNPKHERYAFERALLVPRLQAARAAGYPKMTAGNAAKLDRNLKIAARIAELRSADEEYLKNKRRLLDERLSVAAFGNMFDFTSIDPDTKMPVLDWDALAASDMSVVVSEFTFDKETGALVRFKRDDALNAVSQLRDMHGFKAPTKAELTGKDGAPLVPAVDDAARAKALLTFMKKTQSLAKA